MQGMPEPSSETWASEIQSTPLEPLDALQGSLADVDVEGLLRRERETELAKDQRWSLVKDRTGLR